MKEPCQYIVTTKWKLKILYFIITSGKIHILILENHIDSYLIFHFYDIFYIGQLFSKIPQKISLALKQ